MLTQSLPCRRGRPVTMHSYRLPNGTVPVLLSGDTPEQLLDDATALLSYAADHPEVPPHRIAEMLFRTRTARRHRALAMVTDLGELVIAVQAIIDGREHPSVVRTDTPAGTRRVAYVFPGQGGQRPGMGRIFYESIPGFRAEVERCAEFFRPQFGDSPLDYLLDEDLPAEDHARTVQPALFTQMAGLAAVWRSLGIAPTMTIGHSQGEIAAAYVAGAMTLADAALVVAIRARAADEFARGDYAMAVVATDRDTCEDLLARCSGWAQLSVINSPNMVGVSGDRETVQAIVDTFTERGMFARVIRVQYPAHTSLINELGNKVRLTMRCQLENPKFLDTETECLGATLGGPITPDLPIDQYWFWNLRNTVRFDKAIAAATQRGICTFLELTEHPTLQLAIQENLAVMADDRATTVAGTSVRTATGLDELTHNLASLAVRDLDYPWDCLRTGTDSPVSLPLADFPNSRMLETRLWLPYDFTPLQPAVPASFAKSVATEKDPEKGRTALSAADPGPARLLLEEWVRLSRRCLAPPRAIGIVDHTGACSTFTKSLCAAAGDFGATASVVDVTDPAENTSSRDDLDVLVWLVPPSEGLEAPAAVARVATFFGERNWWPKPPRTVSECWLVTFGAEAVVAEDVPPDPVHAAASAGFRCIGVEYPGVRFRHLDLPAALAPPESVAAIFAALHTAEEPELALRSGGLYAKRIVEAERSATNSDSNSETATPGHVLILGGTGKLGLEFCRYFAQLGARRITLASRSAENSAVADQLQQVRAATRTELYVQACDVGEQAAVSRLADALREDPADFIIHAAVEYADIELADLTVENVGKVLQAKVIGIWRVLAMCPRTSDCRVLFCSSTAATIGGRGQVAYAAANRMLDAMAHRLRTEGMNCNSVQWGQWKAHFQLDPAGLAKLAATGVIPMSPAEAVTLGLNRSDRNVIVAAYDLARARSALEPYGYGPLLSQLNSPVAERTTAVAKGNLSQRFMELLAETIGMDHTDALDVAVPMVAIGLDSLQALEFRRRVKAEFDYELGVADLLGGASIADVLSRLG